MNDFLNKMNDPKYKLAGYLLGIFVIFIIALCLPKNKSNDIDNINTDKVNNDSHDDFLNYQDDFTYDFQYILKVNNQTITYQGKKTSSEEYITIIDDKSQSYLLKDGLYYVEKDGTYQMYDDNIYVYKMDIFTNGKILTNYINKGYLKDNTYLINLSDIIYDYDGDNEYIKIDSIVLNGEYIINIDCKDYLDYIYQDIESASVEIKYSNIVKK